MKLLCLFLLTITTALVAKPHKDPQAVFISEHPESAQNVIFTLGFPRSGQNWLNVLMQITGRHPSYPLYGTYSLENPLNVGLDFSKKPFYMMHNPHWAAQASSDSNLLVVIVRDYKECFVRQAIAERKRHRIEHLKFLRLHQQPFPNVYYDIIQLYDKWNPSNRHLIYYEDLIKDPENVLRSLSQFLGNTQDGVTYLMERYDHFKALSIAHYNKKEGHCGGSISKGSNDYFHSQKHSLEGRLALQKTMIDHNPSLHDKYLSRYLIKP